MSSSRSAAPLTSALGYALNPYNIFYTRALLSDSVAAFLLALGLLIVIFAVTRERGLLWVAAGLVFGAAALCRAELILFPGFVALCLLLRAPKDWRRGIVQGALCVAGAVAAISPWMIRNVTTFHRPVPIAVGAIGNALFLGSFETEKNWHGWNDVPESVFPDPAIRARILALRDTLTAQQNAGSIDMGKTDKQFMTMAVSRIRQHPMKTVSTWLNGTTRLWYQNYIPMYRDREASGVFFLMYLALAVYAFVRASRSKRPVLAVPGVLMLYLTLVLLPLHIEPRFSIGAMPGLVAVAGVGLWRLFTDIMVRLRGSVPVLASLSSASQ
jgi:4-amino-4-deoxy-L-arabinose transferase-like glycosyltransferase